MADRVSAEMRSKIMRSVRTKDTGPELTVRSAMHRVGFRFRLHDPRLPGRPDLVLPRWKTVIFVNGCFWHQHENCRKATVPKSNARYWAAKFAANVARDERCYRELGALGWRVIVVWQCQATTREAAISRIDKLLRFVRAVDRRATKTPRKQGSRSVRS